MGTYSVVTIYYTIGFVMKNNEKTTLEVRNNIGLNPLPRILSNPRSRIQFNTISNNSIGKK